MHNRSRQTMMCQIHQRAQTIDICQTCNFKTLCQICKKQHSRQYNNHQIIRLESLIHKASKNISLQCKKLDQYIQPFEKKKLAHKQVLDQINQLQNQKRRLIKIVQEHIKNEIFKISQKNGIDKDDIYNNKIHQQLNEKKQVLLNMKQNLNHNKVSLKQALKEDVEIYLYKIGKVNRQMTERKFSSNMAYLYDKVQHEFVLSTLQLKIKRLTSKLIKKVYNESPLYYLIDPKYQTSKYLHYFVSDQKQLRIFDVQTTRWQKFKNTNDYEFPNDYATLYDHIAQRFYYIGGVKDNRKSNKIVSFDLTNEKWGISQFILPRSSCMATIIQNKYKNKGNFLLIAGGIDQNKKVIKSWELYDTDAKKVIFKGDMNFATASGKLVTYQGDIVFKIGGFTHRSQKQLGICPILEKCDFSKLNHSFNANQQFKFSYIQVQDIKRQSQIDEKQNYKLYYGNQGAIQINANQILIFGGQDKTQKGSSGIGQTYILNIEKFQIQNYKKEKVISYRYYARWINQKPLISSEHFQFLNHSIWNSRLHSLQNISGLKQKQTYKRWIQFDMKCWYQTQNIVDDIL